MKLKKCWRVTVIVYEMSRIIDGLEIDFENDPNEAQILNVVQTVKDREPTIRRYMEVYIKQLYKVED